MTSLKIGVVGYCPPTVFDEDKALQLLSEALDEIVADHPDVTHFIIVSGLTNVGVPALAYYAAMDRMWGTVGIAGAQAESYECFPVDERVIVSEEQGNESETFANACSVGVRIGSGEQSHDEMARLKARGCKVYERELAAISP